MIPTNTTATVDLATKLPAKVEAVAVLIRKGGEAGDLSALGRGDQEAVRSAVAAKLATGKANEVVTQIVNEPALHRVLVVGVGEKPAAQALREAGAAVAKAARRQKLKGVALVVPGGVEGAVEAIATGFLLGSFSFREFKGSASKGGDGDGEKRGAALTLVVAGADAGARRAVERARVVAEGQNLARTVASRPGNEINPPTLAKVAQGVAKEAGLTCRVLDEKELARLGMGGLLAVGGGSPNPPRLIVLEHKGSGGRGQGSGKKAKASGAGGGGVKPILLVGKSITFDTGGISIKPADKMGDMIYDKSGGMTVLGLMYVLARLDFPLPVVGLLTSAENHVSGTAYRPGDIIRHYNGVTSEITNTDAEGRLVLADAIAWGIEQYRPAAVVDLATLTGGCVVALGHTIAGLFSNDDALAAELTAAAGVAGEKVWRLPVGDEHREMLKSNHADVINSAGRWGSALTGAAYLTYALGEKWETAVPWAHFDIAGVADAEKETPLYARGATGWGVRTLLEWLTARANSKG